MKKIVFQNLRTVVLAFIVISIIASCKKESAKEQCSGQPVITKISGTTDRTVSTEAGSLSDWIIIQGTDLCGVTKMMFNDIEVNLANAYITPNEITVSVPRGIPTEINDKVTLQSQGGSTTFDYKVSIPDLLILGMYNEYTQTGATMTILGKNFDLYELDATNGKVVFDGTEVAIDRATPDSIFFKVPMDASVNAKLKLKDKRGIETIVPGQYKDNRGMIYTMDRTDYWNSAQLTTQDGPIPAPVNGKYAYWKGSYNSWDWNEHYHVVSNPKLADINVVGSSNNFSIKFEIDVLNDWDKNALKIKILGKDYEWKPFTNLPFTTSGWKTITIPLSVYKQDGSPIQISQAEANANTEMRLYIHGGDPINIDMAIDNFRIVPNN